MRCDVVELMLLAFCHNQSDYDNVMCAECIMRCQCHSSKFSMHPDVLNQIKRASCERMFHVCSDVIEQMLNALISVLCLLYNLVGGKSHVFAMSCEQTFGASGHNQSDYDDVS